MLFVSVPYAIHVEVWVPKKRSHEYEDANPFKTLVGYDSSSLHLHCSDFEVPFRKWNNLEMILKY